jgi:hypothetical protein
MGGVLGGGLRGRAGSGAAAAMLGGPRTLWTAAPHCSPAPPPLQCPTHLQPKDVVVRAVQHLDDAGVCKDGCQSRPQLAAQRQRVHQPVA